MGMLASIRQGKLPADVLTYRLAAQSLERGTSPYGIPEASRQTWRDFHRLEARILAADARGEGLQAMQAHQAQQDEPGPYLYPPTLALLVAAGDLPAEVFVVLLLLSIAGFCRVWLASTGAGSLWLGMAVGSWSVLSSVYLGNAKLLLFASLLAAQLL